MPSAVATFEAARSVSGVFGAQRRASAALDAQVHLEGLVEPPEALERDATRLGGDEGGRVGLAQRVAESPVGIVETLKRPVRARRVEVGEPRVEQRDERRGVRGPEDVRAPREHLVEA
ncbi:MAG: hypothetical protein AAGH64_00725 [Planctomycetota bacterium]